MALASDQGNWKADLSDGKAASQDLSKDKAGGTVGRNFASHTGRGHLSGNTDGIVSSGIPMESICRNSTGGDYVLSAFSHKVLKGGKHEGA